MLQLETWPKHKALVRLQIQKFPKSLQEFKFMLLAQTFTTLKPAGTLMVRTRIKLKLKNLVFKQELWPGPISLEYWIYSKSGLKTCCAKIYAFETCTHSLLCSHYLKPDIVIHEKLMPNSKGLCCRRNIK